MKFTIELTDEEYEKLKALAEYRTERVKGRTKYTPEGCIKDFIRSCQAEPSGWIPPDKAAQLFQAKKRAEASEEDAKKSVIPSSTS